MKAFLFVAIVCLVGACGNNQDFWVNGCPGVSTAPNGCFVVCPTWKANNPTSTTYAGLAYCSTDNQVKAYTSYGAAYTRYVALPAGLYSAADTGFPCDFEVTSSCSTIEH